MAGLVDYPGGGFYPNMVEQLINGAWAAADAKSTAFTDKAGQVVTALDSASVPDITFTDVSPENIAAETFSERTVTAKTIVAEAVTAATVNPITVTEPSVYIPSTMSAADVMNVFDSKYIELVAMLVDKFTAFRNAWFPDESAVYTAAETWLGQAIANPDAGLPVAVAAQLLEDERSRVLGDVARASDAAMATFAARRFPLPPGAAAGAVLQIQQKGQGEIAAAGRKITMASIEQMKFAIEKAISLRQLAMSSTVEYIKALASGPDMASRVVGIGYDAQSKLISSVSSFYGARTEAQKLMASPDQINAKFLQDADTANAGFTQQMNQHNQRAIQDADAANNASLQAAETATHQAIQQTNQANKGFIQQANTTNATLSLQASEKNAQIKVQLLEERVKALLAEAGVLGQMSSALYNNLNAGATLSTSDGYSTSVAGGGTLPIDPN